MPQFAHRSGLLSLLGVLLLSDAGFTEESARTQILKTDGLWRVYTTLRQEYLGNSAEDAKREPPDKNTGLAYNTPAPPADWVAPDFDDSGWKRAFGPFTNGNGVYGFGDNRVAMLCVRGKFAVTNPEQVKGLTVSVIYRGGVVVYLNGKEIARAHLRSGALDAETPGDAYPIDCWVKPDGKSVISLSGGEPEKFKERCEMRIRRLENITVSGRLLRRGVNILAIELHRSPVPVSLRQMPQWERGKWATLGLLAANLVADGPEGVVPNIERPKGVQVWVADEITSIFDTDYADPLEPLRPMRLVGAKNGSFAGQVVVSSDSPIRGLKVAATGLRLVGAGAMIPAASVRIRYPVATGSISHRGLLNVRYFDALADSAPEEIAVAEKPPPRGSNRPRPVPGVAQPVWVTVDVPRDAMAGRYEGALRVSSAEMDPVDVPLHLKVADWNLPNPHDFVTHADFVQSPESVAYRYEVPLWSDRHFELLAKSLELLGKIGNKTIYIPLLCQTNHGNAETMVRWIKDGEGYRHDFSVMEKYLDLYIKYAGKPAMVIFYVWEAWTGGGYFGSKGREPKPILVSLLDAKSGKVTEMVGPRYDKPEATPFLKPVVDGIRERLTARGLADRWYIGCASDCKPSKEVVHFWQSIAPEAVWVQQGHGLDHNYFGVRVGYNTTVWKAQWAADPDRTRTYGWRRKERVAWFHRDIWRESPDAQALVSRIIGEKNITGNQCGFGRMSADFWPCLKDKDGNMVNSISSRYQISSWAQCNIRMVPYLSPGPDGARSTIRLEAAIGGVQECEARIFIEKALLNPAKRAALGDETAARIQKLLDERTRVILWGTYPQDWQERAEALFEAAAEVQRLAGSD